MKKQMKLNLVLAVLAMGLLAAVVFSKKHDADQEKGVALTSLAADAVTKIAIRHPGSPEIDLEKKDGHWALTAPVQAPADPFELTALTDLAITESHGSVEGASVKKADLGLDPPGYAIQLNDVTIDFGGLEPIKNLRYVETSTTPDAKVAMIDDPVSTALDADYSDLVAKEVLPANADIAKIEVPGLTVERAAVTGWTAMPANEGLSSDSLQKFVDAWRTARSTWNTASERAQPRAPDAPPLDPVTVTMKDGSSLHFVVASRDPQLVLERPDLKVRLNLPRTDVDRLLKPPAPPPPAPAASDSLLPAVPGATPAPADTGPKPAATPALPPKS